VFWSVKRGFFATALTLGSWIVCVALANFLAGALARPLYEALGANAARSLIEHNLDGALQSSQVAQYGKQVLAAMPDVLCQLAGMCGVSAQGLVDNLQSKALQPGSAAQLLEQAVVAPIAVAACRLLLSALLFVILMLLIRLVTRQMLRLRKLPVLKQADALLGAVLGLGKGALLLFVVTLALRALSALRLGGPAFARGVEDSWLVQLFSFSLWNKAAGIS
jgi:uncharacterized membrane protein required for colicin V production